MDVNITGSLDNLTSSLSNITKELEIITESCSTIALLLENMNSMNFSDVLGGLTDIAGILLSVGNENNIVDNLLNNFKAVKNLILSIPTPLIGVTAAIGGVLGALVLYSEYETQAERDTKEFIEAQQEKQSELEETKRKLLEYNSSLIDNSNSISTEYGVLRKYVDKLKELEKNGYVDNFNEVQFYVEKINEILPESVKLTEDGRIEWMKNADAIKENISQLEKKAKVEAYYEGYVESLKNEAKLRSELTATQNAYNNELENQEEINQNISILKQKMSEQGGILSNEDLVALSSYNEQLRNSNEKLEACGVALNEAKGAYDANAKSIELYNLSMESMNGNLEATTLLHAKELLIMENDGTSTWASLAGAVSDYKETYNNASAEEREQMFKTNEYLKTEMVNKANMLGLSYEEMIEQLKSAGLDMSNEEKNQLQKSYEMWALNSEQLEEIQGSGLDTLKLLKSIALSEMNENDKKKLSENVKIFANTGNQSGLQLCQKLAENIEANGGLVDEETNKILSKIEKEASSCKPNTKFGVTGPSEKIMSNIKSTLNSIPSSKNTVCTVTAKADRKSFKIFGIELPFFAAGGFPDTGELFVAREAGPELVGRINGKNAVANNDQIVNGISSGVFNAVSAALKGRDNGNVDIHATFVMDGEVVGKQVIKYHNGVVKRTGNSPLMV